MRFDFFTIWDDRPMPQECIDNIEHVKSLMVGSDTFTLLQLPHFDNIVHTVNASDRMRFDWLAKYPDAVYFDPDCRIHYRFKPIKKGMPYMPICFKEKIADIFLIYCNGATKFFKEKFSDEVREREIARIGNVDRELYYSWPARLNKNLTGFIQIPPEVYYHTYKTTNAETQRRGLRKMSTIETAIAQQQQNTRSINDVVNEHVAHMAELSTAMAAAQQKIVFELRNFCNQQAQEIEKLKAAQAEKPELKLAKKE